MADDWESGELDQQHFQKKAEQIGQPTYKQIGSSSLDYLVPGRPRYVPRAGKNIIRVIRPLEYSEIGGYGLDLFFHRNQGANRDNIVCARGMFATPCGVCNMQTGELYEANPDYWASLTPEKKVLMWLLDLMIQEGEENYLEPLLWPTPKTLAEEILKQSNNPESGAYLDVSHPKTGVPVYFDRTGERRNTKYSGVQIGTKVWPLPVEIKELITPLSDMVNLLSQEAVAKIVAGGEIPDATTAQPSSFQNGTPAPATPPPCYEKEYGKYADCDTDCEFREPCAAALVDAPAEKPSRPDAPAEPPPPPAEAPAPPAEAAPPPVAEKPKKVERPKRPAKPAAPATEAPAATGGDDVAANLRAKIAARQQGKG
jgi:hypothetical protein